MAIAVGGVHGLKIEKNNFGRNAFANSILPVAA